MTEPGTPEDREALINALLDGELDEASSAVLKAAAEEDRVLARALVEAWQLQRSLDDLQLEQAPASLRRKLHRIPFERTKSGRGRVFDRPRWAVAGGLAGGLAVVAALAVGLVLLQRPTSPGNWPPGNSPSVSLLPPGAEQALLAPESDSARAEQTRRELKIAFHYLDKAGFRVGREINEALNDELSAPIKKNLSRIIPHSGKSPKEKNV